MQVDPQDVSALPKRQPPTGTSTTPSQAATSPNNLEAAAAAALGSDTTPTPTHEIHSPSSKSIQEKRDFPSPEDKCGSPTPTPTPVVVMSQEQEEHDDALSSTAPPLCGEPQALEPQANSTLEPDAREEGVEVGSDEDSVDGKCVAKDDDNDEYNGDGGELCGGGDGGESCGGSNADSEACVNSESSVNADDGELSNGSNGDDESSPDGDGESDERRLTCMSGPCSPASSPPPR
mmetsp:Transcript_31566/g.68274  ORF Transcript_31566/g.68274 Transcript_31566/m.68274 type:complete len:234 (+) Transcript_31566:315-1016(+)